MKYLVMVAFLLTCIGFGFAQVKFDKATIEDGKVFKGKAVVTINKLLSNEDNGYYALQMRDPYLFRPTTMGHIWHPYAGVANKHFYIAHFDNNL